MAPILEVSSWPQQILKQLRESGRKTTALLALGVIFAVTLFRLLAGQSPATARGAILSAGAGNGSQTLVWTPAPSNKRPEGAISLRQWARQPVVPLTRDLFAISYDYYPRDGSPAAPQDTGSTTGDSAAMAKSLSERADRIQRRQILVDIVRIAAAALKLESTLLGAVPEAVIDGRGQSLHGGPLAGPAGSSSPGSQLLSAGAGNSSARRHGHGTDGAP
jgi:hypothetical protein